MSEVLGVGVDLCSIPRMEKAIAQKHFTERVFTVSERETIASRGKDGANTAAAMFAAKEACAKALGTGFSGGIMPEQFSVEHDPAGAPSVRLYGKAEEKMLALGGRMIRLSLSHEGDMAAAFAVLLS